MLDVVDVIAHKKTRFNKVQAVSNSHIMMTISQVPSQLVRVMFIGYAIEGEVNQVHTDNSEMFCKRSCLE